MHLLLVNNPHTHPSLKERGNREHNTQQDQAASGTGSLRKGWSRNVAESRGHSSKDCNWVVDVNKDLASHPARRGRNNFSALTGCGFSHTSKARYFSEQAQLLAFPGQANWMRFHAVAIVIATNAVLLTQACHQLRKRLAIRPRQERSVLIALPVVLNQLGKLLLQKRQEHSGRAGFQKQRISKDVFSARLSRGADQRL